MEDIIIGIDLGTTNSAVGAVDTGFPMLYADADQNRITPSAVWYGPNGEIEVGRSALRRRNSGVGSLVTSAKRLIGQKLTNIPSYPLPLQERNGEIVIETITGNITPVEISCEILKHLKQIAEKQLNCEISKAVITVPAYFNDAQRAATKKAGELAGLSVERILSEPTAAALSFGLDSIEDSQRVIVYDLGGGTFDVSLLEMNQGVFQVQATSGDTLLGGDDIDRLVAEYAYQKHSTESLNNIDSADQQRLIEEAQRIKESLTTKQEDTFSIPFFTSTENISVPITRENFDKIIAPIIQRTLSHCKQILIDGDIKQSSKDLSHIILVGGSSRIPALLDVTPLSLGIETYGGLMNIIIPRNSTIPCKAGEMFTNAVDQQAMMSVNVLQGEREMAKDNWLLGKVSVPFEPERKGQARVGVQFSIDENGILEVLTRDTKIQKDITLKIETAAVDVDDKKVEAMISESVDYAFDDMSERIFTEASLKAKELLPAVNNAIQQMQHDMSTEELNSIQSAKQEVEKQLESKNASALKQAVQKLDKATEALAAKLVEKAMSDALNKKLDL